MRRMLSVLALAAFSVAPVVSFACDDNDASSASARTPDRVATTPAPAATKVAATKAATTRASGTAKATVVKTQTVPSQKVAASTTN